MLRDASGTRFFDPESYERATRTVARALELIGAAYAPLTLDFSRYRTPFSLLDLTEIQTDARAARNPFHDYFTRLGDRLGNREISFAGLSVAFPGQVQPAYALAYRLKAQMPEIYLTVGGPAITQILCRLNPAEAQHSLGPFDSAVLFEGERSLLELVESVERGGRPKGVVAGSTVDDLGDLPPPDFDGLPLKRYFSPVPVLPYDTTRGCYWNRCAFCHYGLAPSGTAPYRERPVQTALGHLHALAVKHNCRMFYLSQDTLAPAYARKLAGVISETGAAFRWATDMRPEAALTAERGRELARGNALSVALGVESGCERVLRLIDKGVQPATARRAIESLSDAGIAVEAMCMTGLPFETAAEAMETIALLRGLEDRMALFVCCRFDLVPGARMAREPHAFGIAQQWHVEGDAFVKSLFYREEEKGDTDEEWEQVERALERFSSRFWLHDYPWAGAVSTAHSLLYYDHYGPDVFRRLRTRPPRERRNPSPVSLPQGWDPQAIIAAAQAREAGIWHALVYRERSVSRSAYRRLAARRSVSRTFPPKP